MTEGSPPAPYHCFEKNNLTEFQQEINRLFQERKYRIEHVSVFVSENKRDIFCSHETCIVSRFRCGKYI